MLKDGSIHQHRDVQSGHEPHANSIHIPCCFEYLFTTVTKYGLLLFLLCLLYG